jgi:hypothetical protein
VCEKCFLQTPLNVQVDESFMDETATIGMVHNRAESRSSRVCFSLAPRAPRGANGVRMG